jgi:hypothetical protein
MGDTAELQAVICLCEILQLAMAPIILHLAVCLYPNVTALDYQGPIELLSFISAGRYSTLDRLGIHSNYVIDATYFSHSLEPVSPVAGPSVQASRTYDEVKADEQFDILLVPGGGLKLFTILGIIDSYSSYRPGCQTRRRAKRLDRVRQETGSRC